MTTRGYYPYGVRAWRDICVIRAELWLGENHCYGYAEEIRETERGVNSTSSGELRDQSAIGRALQLWYGYQRHDETP
jgi:hypothetical protein